MIHIVIPVFNRLHFTNACLQSLQQQTYTDFKIVVVDHGSTDGTSERIAKQFPEVVILKGDESMWWAAATNLGVKYALANGADYVLTLNNDLIVKPDYLEQILKISNQNPNSITGSVTLDITNHETIIFAGIKWDAITAKYTPSINISLSYTELNKNYTTINSDILPGRGTLIPNSVFKQIGFYDEKNFPHYAADEDFALKATYHAFKLYVAVKAVVYSEVEATGLKAIYKKRNLTFWKDTFFSQKSPVKLSVRWAWAKKHGKLPLMYFLFDISRIVISEIKKSITNEK